MLIKPNLRNSIIVSIRYFPVNGMPTSKPPHRYWLLNSSAVFAVYRSVNSILSRITLWYNILQCRHMFNYSLTDNNH